MQHGVVTRASLIVNGSVVEEAVQMAKQAGFLSVLGLHLNLSEGIPISKQRAATTLCRGGLMLGKQRFREAVMRGEIDAQDVHSETEAQIDKFRMLVGHFPSRVDGHQHCHVLPMVRDVLAEVFARKGVKFTRIPNETADGALCRVCAVVSKEATHAQHVYRSRGIESAECLVGLRFCASPYSPQELATAVESQLDFTRSSSCEVLLLFFRVFLLFLSFCSFFLRNFLCEECICNIQDKYT